MSQFPPMYTPPDPNAYKLDIPPFNYPGVPKGIPTSGGIAPTQNPPPIRIHAPAVGSMMPAQQITIPGPSPAPPAPATGTTQGQTSGDAYQQSLQNAMKADQALIDHPYQQPEYKPPAKGLEYLAMGLGILFPGSPIAAMASGLGGGLYQRAENDYTRKEQAEQQRVSGLERTAQVENQIADAQGAIQQRREAVDERHADTMSKLQQQSQEFEQSYGLKSATLKAKVTYWQGQLANAAARNTITQQDVELSNATHYQVAILQQAGLDRRNTNNMGLRRAIELAQSSTAQSDTRIRSIDAAVAAGTLDPAQAQTQVAAIVAGNQTAVQQALKQASTAAPSDPTLGSVGALQSVGSPTAPASPYAWPPQASSGSEGANEVIGILNALKGVTTGGAQTGNGTLLPHEGDQFNSSAQPPPQGGPIPGHPSLGTGPGVAEQQLKGAVDHYTQAAGQFNSVDALLHDIAISPGAQQLSGPQIQTIVQAWEKTQAAHAQQHANPQAASVKGATSQSYNPAADLGNAALAQSGAASAAGGSGWGELGKGTNPVAQYFKPLTDAMGQAVHGAPGTKPIVQPAAAAEQPHTVLDAITATALNTKGLGEPGVPLLRALVAAESSDNPLAKSPAGAIGFTQLMPGTAAGLHVNPNDPKQNLEGGAQYLAQLLDEFHSIPLALAAYNAGPGAVRRYHGIPPYPETQAYVKRVLGIYRGLTARP